MMRSIAPIVSICLLSAGPARAHFQMLLPASPSGSSEQEVAVVYQWGHPFEHQLFDAPRPEAVIAVTPDGRRIDLSKSLQKVAIAGEGGKKVAAYRIAYTPQRRGDHLLALTTPPIWMPDEEMFFQDTVKVVYHVKTQRGWDTNARLPFELVPLTRPYGLQPGLAFQAQAIFDGKPLAGALVEVERYNAETPKELPPDEQITRQVKTDPNGVFTCTPTEPGWWSVTAMHQSGQKEREGKMYPIRRRATLWVYVDEAPARK